MLNDEPIDKSTKRLYFQIDSRDQEGLPDICEFVVSVGVVQLNFVYFR